MNRRWRKCPVYYIGFDLTWWHDPEPRMNWHTIMLLNLARVKWIYHIHLGRMRHKTHKTIKAQLLLICRWGYLVGFNFDLCRARLYIRILQGSGIWGPWPPKTDLGAEIWHPWRGFVSYILVYFGTWHDIDYSIGSFASRTRSYTEAQRKSLGNCNWKDDLNFLWIRVVSAFVKMFKSRWGVSSHPCLISK